jgi:hypothetical protein
MLKTYHVRFHKRDHTSGLKAVQAEDSNYAKKQFWDGETIITRVYEVPAQPTKKAE